MTAEHRSRPERILEAAEDVLRRYGPAKATVVDVARELGVSHGSVYRHFPSKAALRDAVTERWLRRISAPLEADRGRRGPGAASACGAGSTCSSQSKRSRALEDPELFATYVELAGAVARGGRRPTSTTLVGQLARIIADGVARGEFDGRGPGRGRARRLRRHRRASTTPPTRPRGPTPASTTSTRRCARSSSPGSKPNDEQPKRQGGMQMKVAVMGTGMVGRAIATKLVSLGHEVMMGSRSADNENAVEWAQGAARSASNGTFADAAAFGELVFNCTAGGASLEALGSADAGDLAGKTLIDVANVLDFSHGMPPTLLYCNTDSLGERIQAEFPDAKVVKSLNTMNCEVMVDPSLVAGDHDVFVCGNDDAAKQQVAELLESFGWPRDNVLDLGDISAARGTEMLLPLWLRLYGTLGSGQFNIRVVR